MNEHPLSVLAVDDEPPQLEDLARILRANARVADVETAASGQEAIVKASRRAYDAVFLDVRMPELDGLEVETEPARGTTVVMVVPKFRVGVRAA